MNGRHDHTHTTAVCASLRWSGVLRVVRLLGGSWHGLPCWQHDLCMRCVVSCGNISFPWLVFFFGTPLWGSMIHKHTGRWMWQGNHPTMKSGNLLTLVRPLCRKVCLLLERQQVRPTVTQYTEHKVSTTNLNPLKKRIEAAKNRHIKNNPTWLKQSKDKPRHIKFSFHTGARTRTHSVLGCLQSVDKAKSQSMEKAQKRHCKNNEHHLWSFFFSGTFLADCHQKHDVWCFTPFASLLNLLNHRHSAE